MEEGTTPEKGGDKEGLHVKVDSPNGDNVTANAERRAGGVPSTARMAHRRDERLEGEDHASVSKQKGGDVLESKEGGGRTPKRDRNFGGAGAPGSSKTIALPSDPVELQRLLEQLLQWNPDDMSRAQLKKLSIFQKTRQEEHMGAGAQKDSQREIIRKKIWNLLSVPDSSRWASYISLTILSLIILSSVAFCLETVPELEDQQPFFDVVEYVSVAVFSAEYLLRLATCPNFKDFFKSFLNAVDLLSVLPWYIEQAAAADGSFEGTRILRVIRLVRIFRILKLGGRVGRLEVIGTAVYESLDMLIMLTFLLGISMVLFSSLIYFAEEDTYNEMSGTHSFESIPTAFWWCIVTLMTVGYGDAVPETALGKVIASATMVASIVILALPISVIGTNFTQQWVLSKESAKVKKRSEELFFRFEELQDSLKVHASIVEEMTKELAHAAKHMQQQQESLRTQIAECKRDFDHATMKTSSPRYRALHATASLKRRSIDSSSGAVPGKVLVSEEDAEKIRAHHQRIIANTLLLERSQQVYDEPTSIAELVMSKNFTTLLENAIGKYKRLVSFTDESAFIGKSVERLAVEYKNFIDDAAPGFRSAKSFRENRGSVVT